MLHPDSTLKYVNHVIGSGVFATRFIPKGTITYVKDSLGIEIYTEQFLQHSIEMQVIIDKYSYIDEKGNYVISWDNAKYINHSCEPNTLSTGYGFEIAIKDIFQGDEITDDYGMFNLEQGFKCACGLLACRERILPDDLDKLSTEWDRIVLPALSQLEKVEQPLLKFMDKYTISELNRFVENESRYKSVSSLRVLRENVFEKR